MAHEPVLKVEVTAHNSTMEKLLEGLQQLSVLQIDPHSIQEWEDKKTLAEQTTRRVQELKKELLVAQRALDFLEKFAPPVPILQKLTSPKEAVSKQELRTRTQNRGAQIIKDALSLSSRISDVEDQIKSSTQSRDELFPLQKISSPLSLLHSQKKTSTVVSRVEREQFQQLVNSDLSDFVHIEEISGDEEQVYFYILFHNEARQQVENLQREFHFEPLEVPDIPKPPAEIIQDYTEKIEALESEKQDLYNQAYELGTQVRILRYYYDYLQSELEK
ncbi:MAG: hypothetical protein ACOC7U_02695, partial [Spirochaetota bacterium]